MPLAPLESQATQECSTIPFVGRFKLVRQSLGAFSQQPLFYTVISGKASKTVL